MGPASRAASARCGPPFPTKVRASSGLTRGRMASSGRRGSRGGSRTSSPVREHCGRCRRFVADGEGAARAASGNLWRIDPVGARVTATVRLPRPALALATGFGAVWIAAADGRVFKVDAATARVVGASRRLGRFPATALTTAPSGVVSFTNVSRRRCTLRGVPRVGVLDAVGRILPVIVRGSWPRWRYHQPPVTWPHVIVRPKARPGFFARWRNWCSDARRVAFRVRLPHVRGHVDVPVEAGPGCDGPGSPSSLLVLPVGGDPD